MENHGPWNANAPPSLTTPAEARVEGTSSTAAAAIPTQPVIAGGGDGSTPVQEYFDELSGNSQNPPILLPLGKNNPVSFGYNFMTYTITVNTGEDVVFRVLSYFVEGHVGVMVLNASGTVSRATLDYPGFPGYHTFHGPFLILALTGAFTTSTVTNIDRVSGQPYAHTQLNGGLTVALGVFDVLGNILVGNLLGSLIAATPIEIKIGTFIPGTYI